MSPTSSSTAGTTYAPPQAGAQVAAPAGGEHDRRAAFSAMMAHMLRTPLTAAHGALELMAVGDRPDAAASAELFALARRNTARLLGLVEDCLDLEAAREGTLILVRSDVSAADLVAGAAAAAERARQQRGVAIVQDCATGRVVCGDQRRLVRALAHLIDNALTFAPPGSCVTITAVEDEATGCVRLSVEDCGPGPTTTDIPGLFAGFAAEDVANRQSVGGLGVGLGLVAAIAECHGGRAGMSSAPGRTTAWMELPLS